MVLPCLVTSGTVTGHLQGNVTVTISLQCTCPLAQQFQFQESILKKYSLMSKRIFNAALPVIVKNGKQPKCQLIRE